MDNILTCTIIGAIIGGIIGLINYIKNKKPIENKEYLKIYIYKSSFLCYN